MKDLTKGNIYKTFILFAIPSVLSGVMSQGYAVINTMIAGKILGENALSAIGAISPLETFINSIFWGYGTGVGIYTAQLFGQGKYYRMKSVITSNFKFISAVLVLLSIIMVVFRQSIFDIMHIDGRTAEFCADYFIISMLGKVLLMFGVNCIYVVNAMGDSLFPFLMSALSSVLHILMSVLLILVFGMDVEGLALGNILSATVISAFYFIKILSGFKKLKVNKHKAPFSLRAIKETCRFSVSTMIQQSIMYFAGLVLSPMVNGIGSAATASYTVTLRIYDINANVYQNSAKTIGNYTAQCYGAKKYNLLKKGLKVGLLQNFVFVMPVLLVSILLAKPVAMLFFTADASATAVGYTVDFLRYCMPFLCLNIIANMFHHFFRGIGHMKALLITTVTGSIARIIISWLFIPIIGIYGYYIGWVVSWLFDGFAGVIIYFFGKWRKEIKYT